MAERPTDQMSAEANQIRDELRIATKALDSSMANMAIAMERAGRFISSGGAHTGAIRIVTPATRPTATQIRE